MEGRNISQNSLDIAFVGAHPDDEFLAAIALWYNYKKGGKNYFFCATRGEKGKGTLYKKMSDEEMGRIREKEFYASCTYLGARDARIFGFPDSMLALDPLNNELEKHIRAFLMETMPNIVITFGPGGYTKHLDYITISDITLRICRELGIPVLVITPPPNHICPNFHDMIAAKANHGVYDRNAKDYEHNIHIYNSEEAKLEVIRHHATQQSIDPRRFNKDKLQAQYMLNNEYYRHIII